MTGAKREWLAGRDFMMLHLDLIDALGGSWEAAGVFNRIGFRAGSDGWWTATKAELREDCRLSRARADRAVEELRAAGLIETERVSAFDPTLRWRVIYEGEPGAGNRPHVNQDFGLTVNQDFGFTPLSKNLEEQNPPDEPGEAPNLSLVAAPDGELFASDEVEKPATVPPRNAQTLVGRWVDGHRSTGQADPPRPFMARVAGQCGALARRCSTDADWSAGWHACYLAGQAGRVDPVPFMVQQQTRFPQRTNHHVAAAETAARAGLLDDLLGSWDPVNNRPAIGGTA